MTTAPPRRSGPPRPTGALATALTGVLADTLLLMLKTRSFRWNAEGPGAVPLAEAAAAQATELCDGADALAERLRALGQPAPVGVTDLVSHAELVEETRLRPAARMLEALIEDHETVSARCGALIALAESNGDPTTADLGRGRLATHAACLDRLQGLACA